MTVWLVLLATLFSAASPTLAAALLTDRPAALAQLLGIPARPADEHAHHASHDGAPADSSSRGGGEPEHAAHGIYCSFCLNPSSIATIAAAPVSLHVLHLQFAAVSPPDLLQHRPPFQAVYRSRAPPVFS